MTQKEFEIRTGLTVSADEYAGIEAVYMAAGELNKDVFCAEWKKIGGSRLVMELFGKVMRQRGEIERLKGDEQESRKLLGEAAEYLIESDIDLDKFRSFMQNEQITVEKTTKKGTVSIDIKYYVQ